MSTPDHQAEYDDWLNKRHTAMTTPQIVINDVFRQATGGFIQESTRLVVGQENEVYDVVTNENQNLIVRISRATDPRFEAERWALDAARQVSVPTPRVLAVQQVEHAQQTLTFCIEEKLSGIPLANLLKDAPERVDRHDLASQIGDLLGQLHSVKTDGFGYLQPDGKGWPISFADIMLDLLEKRAELHDAAAYWHVTSQKIDQALGLLKANKSIYDYRNPRLTHGDLGPDHIFMMDGKISGVIDFQECSGNHPVFDFAHWHIYHNKTVPTKEIMAAYPEQELFDKNYADLFQLTLLRNALWMLMVRRDQKNPHNLAGLAQSLDDAIKALS